MRPYEEIWASARDEPPFSNGTEGYEWMDNWCFAPCQQPDEVAWQRYEAGLRKTPPKSGTGCPLLLAALAGKTPIEWLDRWDGKSPYPIDRYHCIEFRPPGGGDDPFDGPAPRPPRAKREPKNMDGLFPRPERRRRMLKQPEPIEVLV